MVTGTHIMIQMDGRTVEGEISSLSPADISIEITSPYSGLQSSRHVPVLARKHVSFTDPEGRISRYGIQRAEELLEELYRFFVYFDENRSRLVKHYREMHERVHVIGTTYRNEEQFAEEKQKLKRLLKAGEIDNLEYQKRLTFLRKSKDTFIRERDRLRQEFVDENFPEGLPVVPEERILALFEGTSPDQGIRDERS